MIRPDGVVTVTVNVPDRTLLLQVDGAPESVVDWKASAKIVTRKLPTLSPSMILGGDNRGAGLVGQFELPLKHAIEFGTVKELSKKPLCDSMSPLLVTNLTIVPAGITFPRSSTMEIRADALGFPAVA